MKTLICKARKGIFTNFVANYSVELPSHISMGTTHITKGEDFILNKRPVIVCGPSIPKRMKEDYEKRTGKTLENIVERFVNKLGMNNNYADTLPFIDGEDIKSGMPIL